VSTTDNDTVVTPVGPTGAGGWPSPGQTPPVPSWCGGVSEAEYSGEDDTGFTRHLCSVDVGPVWCQVQVHQVETWDRGAVTRNEPAVQVWTEDGYTDRYTVEQARALGRALLDAANRLEEAEVEHTMWLANKVELLAAVQAAEATR